MAPDPHAAPTPPAAPTGALELRGPGSLLLDEPLLLRLRGAGPDEPLLWRARLRDDEGRTWRASAPRAEELAGTWRPAKATTGAVASLQSLRPLRIDVRAEVPDGRAASRTVVGRLLADGVRLRRWRDGLSATLHLPTEPSPRATLVLDATAGTHAAAVATLAAPLLASRGVLALTLLDGEPAVALERLRAVPGAAAAGEIAVLPALGPFDAPAHDAVSLPPGIPVRGADPEAATARAHAWDGLLDRLGAAPRG